MNTLSNDPLTATHRRFGLRLATWHRLLASVFTLVGATILGVGCAATTTTEEEHLGSDEAALTAAQCNYFEVNGKVQICHRTGSASHPYSVLKISKQACINAHALHAGDYVAVNDPTCQGGGCLPQNAPCDATLPCCSGFSCVSGTCEANVSDHCSPDPCQNDGICSNNANSYTCACPAGFTGTNCETEIDECGSSPCANGQCLDAINGYVCECAPGWTHPECDVEIDECASSPCQNGDCVDHVNGYTCDCAPGWTHPECDSNIDDCASSPCQNGDCVDHVNAYTCDCAPGWTHPECDSNIDDCASSPCQNGDCVDHVNSYTCTCAPGWGGTNCDVPVVECFPGIEINCNNVCIDPAFDANNCGGCGNVCNSAGGYCQDSGCYCYDGWTGTSCEIPPPVSCPCSGFPSWQPPSSVDSCDVFGAFDGIVEGNINLFSNGYQDQATVSFYSVDGPGGDPPYAGSCYGLRDSGATFDGVYGDLSVAQLQACHSVLLAVAASAGASCQ